VGALRKTTPFREVPIRLYIRGRTTDAKNAKAAGETIADESDADE
jgi:hypothetical protein